MLVSIFYCLSTGVNSYIFAQEPTKTIVSDGEIHLIRKGGVMIEVVGMFSPLEGPTVTVFGDKVDKIGNSFVFSGNVRIVSGNRCTFILNEGSCEIERHQTGYLSTRIKGKSQTITSD